MIDLPADNDLLGPRKNVISTWILLDDEKSASLFPQVGRRTSADPAVQNIYIHCVVVFFGIAHRVLGKSTRYRLYSGNKTHFLKLAGPADEQLLRSYGVEIVEVPLQHLAPLDYCGHFRNQFYIFDVLNFIACEPDTANHLILDSDCIILRSLDEFFLEVKEKGALTLDVGYAPGADINGLTREQMGVLFNELSQKPMPDLPMYLGGEFFAATTGMIRQMLPIAERAWQQSLARHSEGRSKFTEEAHLLSYVYYQLGIETSTANKYARRVWTGLHYRNGRPEDVQLAIFHVPNEKKLGIRTLYRLLHNPTSWVNQAPVTELWVHRVQHLLGVPRPSLLKLCHEFVSRVCERMQH